jgi:hypothetical protein
LSAALADSDLGRLCALARQWQGNPFGLGRARDLAAVLNGIIARRPQGGDVLQVMAHGNSVPEIHADALAKAPGLWGPAAQAEVQSTDTVLMTDRPGYPAYRAYVYVCCVNYAEVSHPAPSLTGGTP